MINNNNNKLVIDNKDTHTHTQNHEDKELHSSSLLTSLSTTSPNKIIFNQLNY